jgi:hypothetical protein
VQIGATNSAGHNPKQEMSSLKLWTGNVLNLKERSGFAARRCENGCFHPLFSPSPVGESHGQAKAKRGFTIESSGQTTAVDEQNGTDCRLR